MQTFLALGGVEQKSARKSTAPHQASGVQWGELYAGSLEPQSPEAVPGLGLLSSRHPLAAPEHLREAIIPKAPITIGLPMALTNQGCVCTCSSMTSG